MPKIELSPVFCEVNMLQSIRRKNIGRCLMVLFFIMPYLWYITLSCYSFHEGQKKEGDILSIGLFFLGVIGGILFLVILIMLLVHLFTSLVTISKIKVVLFFIGILHLIVFFRLPFQPPVFYFLKGFAVRMNKEADIPLIRRETRTVPLNRDDETSIKMLKELPSINQLSPRYVFLMDEKEPVIRLEWGGFAGHWGIVVGSENMEIPRSDIRKYGEYRLKLNKSGAYVFSEIQ